MNIPSVPFCVTSADMPYAGGPFRPSAGPRLA